MTCLCPLCAPRLRRRPTLLWVFPAAILVIGALAGIALNVAMGGIG